MNRFLPKSLMTLALRIVIAFLVVLALSPLRADAHVFKTSNVLVSFDKEGTSYTVEFWLNLEAIMAGVDPELNDTNDSPNAAEYNRLRALPPEELEKVFQSFQATFLQGLRLELDGVTVQPTIAATKFLEVGDQSKARRTIVHIEGPMPAGTKTFSIGWKPEFGKITLRTVSGRRGMMVLDVDAGAMSTPLVIANLTARTELDMVADFVRIGFGHILPEGTDHILFVVGIFLLSTKWSPILTQVSSFTVAHTVTLGLGTAGVVALPTNVVEPLIAASIVYVAVENILRPTLSPWRPAVVFLFGLLHGLGFAGALRDMAIPPGQFMAGLLSFNIGVELGQLTVIAICFLLVGIWFGNKPWYRARIVVPGSLAIAAVGAFWFVQRVWFV